MTPEREALAVIADRAPAAGISYGIDRRGPWATVGGETERARTPADALRAALQKFTGKP